MFLGLCSLELFSQDGERMGLRNHFGFLWNLSTSGRQCGSPCAAIQVLYRCCRSQFYVVPDKPRCGFSGGAGMNSVSLHELQCHETGTYLSSLADNICLLRLLVSLLEFLLPPAMFPVSGRYLRVSARSAAPPDSFGICKFPSLRNGSLWGFNLCTCASTSHPQIHGLRIWIPI